MAGRGTRWALKSFHDSVIPWSLQFQLQPLHFFGLFLSLLTHCWEHPTWFATIKDSGLRKQVFSAISASICVPAFSGLKVPSGMLMWLKSLGKQPSLCDLSPTAACELNLQCCRWHHFHEWVSACAWMLLIWNIVSCSIGSAFACAEALFGPDCSALWELLQGKNGHEQFFCIWCL